MGSWRSVEDLISIGVLDHLLDAKADNVDFSGLANVYSKRLLRITGFRVELRRDKLINNCKEFLNKLKFDSKTVNIVAEVAEIVLSGLSQEYVIINTYSWTMAR